MTKKVQNSKKRHPIVRILRFLFKAFFVLILFLFVISSILVGLSQLQFFKEFTAKQATSILNNSLQAQLEIDEIGFTGLLGLELKNVLMTTAGDTLAFIPKLNVNAEIEPFFQNRIVVNHVILHDPTIKILRSNKDSLWNYEKIAKPSDEKDTSDTGPSNLVISVDDLQIINANVMRYDSTKDYTKRKALSYDHLVTKNFDIKLNSEIAPGNNKIFANIQNLSFEENNSGLKVEKFATRVEISEDYIEAADSKFISKDSKVRFDAIMKNFYVLSDKGNKDIENVVFELDFETDSINTEDIYYFAEIPINIDGTYKLDAKFKGTLNAMEIEKIELGGNTAEINMKGQVQNLLDIENFAYNILIENSSADDKTASKVLPDLNLDQLPEFGNVRINEMFVFGKIDTVFTDFKIKTTVGNLNGNAGAGYAEGKDITYSLQSNVKNLNLGELFANNSLKSKLNGNVNLKGSGTSLEDLKLDMKLALDKSKINDYEFISLKTNANKISNILTLDSLEIIIDRNNTELYNEAGYSNQSSILIVGLLDIANLNSIKYDINLRYSALNVANIINNEDLPQYLSGNLEIEGEGFHPDSLDAKLKAEFNETIFDDKAMFPFDLKAEVSQKDNDNRFAKIESDFFNAEIKGKYKFSELFSSLSNQGIYLGGFVTSKIDEIMAIKPDSININESFQISKIDTFPTIDCKFSAQIKDITPVSTFIDSLNLNLNTSFDISLYSEGQVSSLTIDSIKINNFDLDYGEMKIHSDPVLINGSLLMSIKDSTPYFEDLTMNYRNGNKFNFNDVAIENTDAFLNYNGKDLDFKVSSLINKEIGITSHLLAQQENEKIFVTIDSTRFEYLDYLKWDIYEPIKAVVDNNGVQITKFNLGRDSNEVIELSGTIKNNTFENTVFKIEHFKISDLIEFIPPQNRNEIPKLNGNLNYLTMQLEKSFSNPDIKISTSIDSLYINKIPLGEIKSEIFHTKDYMQGYLDVFKKLSDNSKKDPKLFSVELNYFPYRIGLDSNGFKFTNKYPMDLRVKAEKMPLSLASPFVPAISDLTGFADGSFVVEGFFPDELQTTGEIELTNAEFLVDNLNISYKSSGKIKMENNKIELQNISLKNQYADNPKGKANINGYVTLDGFQPGEMDIKIDADQLLVLSDASRATMPDLYGRFIISTGDNPINFSGTLQKPSLTGDIDVNRADLKMEQSESKATTTSKLEYIRVKDKHYAKISFVKDTSDTTLKYIRTKEKEKTPKENEENIADLINYDLQIRLLSNVNILMDLPFGEMYAVIRTEIRNEPIRYIKKRNVEEANIYGADIILDDRSALKIGKILKTEGEITFPTGSVQNPFLDLVAIYEGDYSDSDNQRHTFMVKIFLKGTMDNLDVNFTYFVDGIEAAGDREKIEQEALITLINGAPPDAGVEIGGNTAMDLGVQSASNFASNVLSDALGGTGIITGAELDFNSQSISDSRVKVTGQLGDLNVSVGGSLQNIDESYEILVELPLSNYTEKDFWRNWVIQLSRSTRNNVISTTDEKNWEFKVKFGGRW